jgi:hypothetical protein
MKYLKVDSNIYDVVKAINRIVTILYMFLVLILILIYRLHLEGVL